MTAHRERPADYADAFELHWGAPDAHPTATWLRAGLEGAPRALRGLVLVAHRVVLGFRLGPLDSSEHVLGWRITADEPDRTVLEAGSWLYDGMITTRRLDATTAVLATSLRYRRPGPARAVWAGVGPVHRLVAPVLLVRAARTLGVPGPHRVTRVPPG